LGEAPFFSQVAITDGEIAQARSAFFEPKFSQAEWFFGAEDVTLHFGYAYGYRLCKAYALETGQKASELVNVPTLKVAELTSHMESRTL
jgi:uncharacterized protein YjaZ